MQSVPITTDVVSSNLDRDEVTQTNIAVRIILYTCICIFSVCGKKACHKVCRYDNK